MDYITQGETLQTGVPQIYRKKDIKEVPATRSSSESNDSLDTPEMQQRLKQLMQYRRQARVAQADNRMEQAIDEDYYDSIQYEPEDLHIFMERNQPPLVFNIIKNTINWIIGTELKNRIDYRVLPRTKASAQSAKAKTKLFKYVQDVSKGEFERSQAFQECIKAGVGWLEMAGRNNDDCPIFEHYERWRNMWFDHLGTRHDCMDWRYVIREKWCDLDVAQAMFPERINNLKVLAEGVNSLYPYLPDDVVVTDNASEFDLESDLDSLFGGPFDGLRERVKLVEMWYRMPAKVNILRVRDEDTPYGTLDGAIYRRGNKEHDYLVDGGYFSTYETTKMTVRCAIWAGATYLQDMLTPYNHDRFPFIPMFCYRRKRDNMPYGVVRDLRDPQADFNRRRSRSLFLLTANQVWYEKGSVDDPIRLHDEINRPDGMVELKEGALAGGKVQKIDQTLLAEAHVKMSQDSLQYIQDIAGIMDPNLGKTERSLSGVALGKLEVQGHTTSGVFFDNYYYAFQNAGEIKLSLIEQFFDQEDELLITGDQAKDEFVNINKRNEDGTVENAITKAKARFIVSKQDYRESVRQAMFETLSTLVQSLAQSMPEVALALLDEVIEYMDDLPNKDEMVARIRKINKQHAPEEEMTPQQREEFKATEQQVMQEQNALKQIQAAMAQAQLAIKQAEAADKQTQALKNQVDAQMKRLEGFLKALEVAGTISQSPALVGAADTLIAEAQQTGGNGGGRRMMDRGQLPQ